jgi:hypothetical protein
MIRSVLRSSGRARFMRHLRFVAVAVVVGVAALTAAAKPASAGLLTCNASSERPFAAWGDYSPYTLAPNGSFEQGSQGWSLSGARVVSGGNSFRSGNYSLSLPAGSSATSPSACVKLADPASRFFVRNTGSEDGRLKVEVTYKTLLGLFTFSSTLGYVEADGSWQPSPKYGHTLQNVLATLSLNGLSAQLRFRFTPVGRGASFQVDDLFVDPLVQI